MGISKEDFLSWPLTGEVVNGRAVRTHAYWGHAVWWSDRFGVVGPIVAALGGPAGYEQDTVEHEAIGAN